MACACARGLVVVPVIRHDVKMLCACPRGLVVVRCHQHDGRIDVVPSWCNVLCLGTSIKWLNVDANQMKCCTLALWNCWDIPMLQMMWSYASLHSLPAWYANEIAMICALALMQLLQCNDVKFCDPVPNAIAVALPAKWIVKANENQNSYGNTIEFNFLLKGLNLLLKSVGKQRLPLAIPCEDMNVFAHMNVIPKRQSLASYGKGIRVLFGLWAKFYSVEKYSDTKQWAGSHIRSCWLLGINIRGDSH